MMIPSIDIMGGKAVQLEQGSKKVLEETNIERLANEFSIYGPIALVDLDAAMNKGSNKDIIMSLCKKYECRVGGGIRSEEIARQYLKSGAAKIIIGTKATPEFLKKLPKQFTIAALDNKYGEVRVEGWKKGTGERIEDKIKELEPYCSEFLITLIELEGMMGGTDIKLYENIRKLTQLPVTAAGGISTTDEIKRLESINVNSQLGMSLYKGKIDLVTSFIEVVKFNPLCPTIVANEYGQILMLAYSSRESLEKAIKTRQGTYFSRSRNKLWVKGETSGNSQQLLKVRYDCDCDTLLFHVKQKNSACHRGNYSCFGAKKFDLKTLLDILKTRSNVSQEDSYTSKLLQDPEMLTSKILEEAKEVTDFNSRENLVWEIADVIYMISVLMTRESVAWEEIENELRGRIK